MNLNATLVLQIITFAFFVWFCMKYVWPPITGALAERHKKIADGLLAAEKSFHAQEAAESKVKESLDEAKQQAAEIISQAQKRASEMVEEAKTTASSEGERIKAAAHAEVEKEINRAKEQLRAQVSVLALSGAEKILQKEVDASTHQAALDELAAQI